MNREMLLTEAIRDLAESMRLTSQAVRSGPTADRLEEILSQMRRANAKIIQAKISLRPF